MNYLVIDLEMCRVPQNYRGKRYKYATEIIQIGAVLLDDEYRQIASLSQYVCPEHGVVDHFISNLTGILNSQVKKAPKLKDALLHILDWLGEREYKVIAWSENDYIQLQHEITNKKIECGRIDEFMQEDRWINYQKTFGERYEYERSVSLEEALLLCNIEPDGRLHDGLDDAVNTAKIIEKLEQNPEYQLIYTERQEEFSSEPLQTSLGELFADLNIKLM